MKGKDFWFILADGKATPTTPPTCELQHECITRDQGLAHMDFPSGRRLAGISLNHRYLTYRDANNPKLKLHRVEFDYPSEGGKLMGLVDAPNGTIFGGSMFPHCYFVLHPDTGKIDHGTDYTSQWNILLRSGDNVYIGAYTHGRIYDYHCNEPLSIKDDKNANPHLFGACNPEINRPATLAVMPDKKTLLMGGTPEYGCTGGGLAIVDLADGKLEVLPSKQLVPDESITAMLPLDNDLILMGTTIEGGTGGETKAKNCSLLLFSLSQRKVMWQGKPFPKGEVITCLTQLPDGSVIGIENLKMLFRFDPKTRQVVAKKDFGRYSEVANDEGPRDIFTYKGEYYLLLRHSVAKFNPETCAITAIAPSPVSIRNGGAVLGDRLFFVVESHIWSINLANQALFLSPNDCNGNFARIQDGLPIGWKQNKGDWNKPWGTVTLQPRQDGNDLRIVTSTVATQLYSDTQEFPVQPGDKMTLEMTASGKGTVQLGIYGYDHGRSIYIMTESFAVSAQPETFRKTFVIPPTKTKKEGPFLPGTTDTIKLMFGAAADSDVMVSSFKLIGE
ncbi:MAG: hypothetical protein PHQ27_10160 [Victivallales bacterium]|nr:hypothetical protein [Victivallales bacterium]